MSSDFYLPLAPTTLPIHSMSMIFIFISILIFILFYFIYLLYRRETFAQPGMTFWRLPIPFVARHLPSRACNFDDFPYHSSLDTIHLKHRQLFMTTRPFRVSPPEFGWKSTSARGSPKHAIPRVKKYRTAALWPRAHHQNHRRLMNERRP